MGNHMSSWSHHGPGHLPKSGKKTPNSQSFSQFLIKLENFLEKLMPLLPSQIQAHHDPNTTVKIYQAPPPGKNFFFIQINNFEGLLITKRL